LLCFPPPQPQSVTELSHFLAELMRRVVENARVDNPEAMFSRKMTLQPARSGQRKLLPGVFVN
jgi:hypothetical protein